MIAQMALMCNLPKPYQGRLIAISRAVYASSKTLEPERLNVLHLEVQHDAYESFAVCYTAILHAIIRTGLRANMARITKADLLHRVQKELQHLTQDGQRDIAVQPISLAKACGVDPCSQGYYQKAGWISEWMDKHYEEIPTTVAGRYKGIRHIVTTKQASKPPKVLANKTYYPQLNISILDYSYPDSCWLSFGYNQEPAATSPIPVF